MSWHYHIMLLARIRPLPDYVRNNPAYLAEPLARETGAPLAACLKLVENMIKKTPGQLRRKGISANWALEPPRRQSRPTPTASEERADQGERTGGGASGPFGAGGHRSHVAPPPPLADLEPDFALLGISPTSDLAAVSAAYRRQARVHHPDVGGGNGARMARINEAYRRLRDRLGRE